MDKEQELYKSLSDLETTLKEIDSAKEQVNKTINSYNKIGDDLQEYTNSLNTISKNIDNIIHLFENNGTILSTKIIDFQKLIGESQNTINSLQTNFKQECIAAVNGIIDIKDKQVNYLKELSNSINSLKDYYLNLNENSNKLITLNNQKIDLCYKMLQEMSLEITQQNEQLNSYSKTIIDLNTELERIKNITWYQKLFGKN